MRRAGALRPISAGLAVGSIAAVALGLRLVVVVASSDYAPRNDAADYERLAQGLLHGRSFGVSQVAGHGPTAFRPPLYPLFLAALHAMVGDGLTPVRVLQAVLALSTVALCGLLGLRLAGRRAGIIAAGIAAAYLPLVLTDTVLLSETLFLPLLLGAVLAALRARAGGRWPWSVAAGTLIGAAVLTRPISAPVVVAVGLVVWSWRRAALVALAAGLVVAPWLLRNQARFGGLVLTTQAGFHLAGTYNDTSAHDPAHPAAWRPPNLDPAMARLLAQPAADERRLEERFRGAAVDYAIDHLGYVVEVVAWNSLRTADLSGIEDQRNLLRGDLNLSPGFAVPVMAETWALLAAAAAAVVAGAARRVPWQVALVPALALAPALVSRGDARFRSPVDVFLIVVVAVAIDQVLSSRAARSAVGAGAGG